MTRAQRVEVDIHDLCVLRERLSQVEYLLAAPGRARANADLHPGSQRATPALAAKLRLRIAAMVGGAS